MGKHAATVMVLKSNGTSANGSLTFAAIGGPLAYSVENAEPGMEVPIHDHLNPTHPFHLQYFDYIFPIQPTDSQKSQTGLASVVLAQPPVTTYEWHITRPAQRTFGTPADATTLKISANGGSTSGGVKVRLTYHYDDQAGLSGSAEDDSEETPLPGTTAPNATYYSFTAHRPTRVEKKGVVQVTHQAGGVWPNTAGWTYINCYSHILYDNNSAGQPGVWVTERFPNAAAEFADWNAATGQNLSFENAGTNGILWNSRSSAGFV